jgi:hypothetical protein
MTDILHEPLERGDDALDFDSVFADLVQTYGAAGDAKKMVRCRAAAKIMSDPDATPSAISGAIALLESMQEAPKPSTPIEDGHAFDPALFSQAQHDLFTDLYDFACGRKPAPETRTFWAAVQAARAIDEIAARVAQPKDCGADNLTDADCDRILGLLGMFAVAFKPTTDFFAPMLSVTFWTKLQPAIARLRQKNGLDVARPVIPDLPDIAVAEEKPIEPDNVVPLRAVDHSALASMNGGGLPPGVNTGPEYRS